MTREDVVAHLTSELTKAGFDEDTAAKMASKMSPVGGRGVSPQELISLMDSPTRALPEKAGGGFTAGPDERAERLKRKVAALKNLGAQEGAGGRVFLVPPSIKDQVGRAFADEIGRRALLMPKALPAAPARTGSSVDTAGDWGGPKATLGDLPGLNAERVSIPTPPAPIPVWDFAAGAPKTGWTPGGDTRRAYQASAKGASPFWASPNLLSRGLSRLGRFVKANPGTAAIDAVGFGLPLLGMAKDAVNWGSRQVTGDPLIGRELTVDQSLEMEKKVRMEQMRLQIQQQERAKVLTANTINLLQYAPDVARQVMAGRRLPKGAVVIGGTPRVDLMQEVAGQMADGAYQEQDPLTQLTGMMR